MSFERHGKRGDDSGTFEVTHRNDKSARKTKVKQSKGPAAKAPTITVSSNDILDTFSDYETKVKPHIEDRKQQQINAGESSYSDASSSMD